MSRHRVKIGGYLCAVLALTVLIAACEIPASEGGESLEVAGQFVAITYGRNGLAMQYIVVQSWPRASTPEERLADKRSYLDESVDRVVTLEDGRHVNAATQEPSVYFYEGDKLTRFAIDVDEDTLDQSFSPRKAVSYRDILTQLRRFAKRGASGPAS